jgi:hypothetical protein
MRTWNVGTLGGPRFIRLFFNSIAHGGKPSLLSFFLFYILSSFFVFFFFTFLSPFFVAFCFLFFLSRPGRTEARLLEIRAKLRLFLQLRFRFKSLNFEQVLLNEFL